MNRDKKGGEMLVSKDQIKKIIDFQKKKSRELKRQLTYSEAVALWFTQKLVVESGGKKGTNDSWPELYLY